MLVVYKYELQHVVSGSMCSKNDFVFVVNGPQYIKNLFGYLNKLLICYHPY